MRALPATQPSKSRKVAWILISIPLTLVIFHDQFITYLIRKKKAEASKKRVLSSRRRGLVPWSKGKRRAGLFRSFLDAHQRSNCLVKASSRYWLLTILRYKTLMKIVCIEC